MKRSDATVCTRDLAIPSAPVRHPKIRWRLCFPSHERRFSTFYPEAALKISGVCPPPERHPITTSTLHPSVSGVI